mmetsp:Transcript_15417/g.38394  ORF Transcript_15417/g.38394 Transcript_15417/m.38394 type:complete len:218 (-) Transcript_15417:319-972(-)
MALLHLGVDGVSSLQHHAVIGLRQVVAAGHEVHAGTRVVGVIDVLRQQVQPLHLQQQVHRLWLRVVRHVVRHDLGDQRHEVVGGRALALPAQPPLLGDLARQVAHVLVAPHAQRLLAALQPELERVAHALLGRHRGGQHRHHVRQQRARLRPHGQRLAARLEAVRVRRQELERLGHAGHCGGGGADLVDHGVQCRHLHARIGLIHALNHKLQVGLQR